MSDSLKLNSTPAGERDPWTWTSPNANAAPTESATLAAAQTPALPAPPGTPSEAIEDLRRA